MKQLHQSTKCLSYAKQQKKSVHPKLNYKRMAISRSLQQRMLTMHQYISTRRICNKKINEKTDMYNRSSKSGNRAQKRESTQALVSAYKEKVPAELEQDRLVKVEVLAVSHTIKTSSISSCNRNISSCQKFLISNLNS